jgi:hypothetical protein
MLLCRALHINAGNGSGNSRFERRRAISLFLALEIL